MVRRQRIFSPLLRWHSKHSPRLVARILLWLFANFHSGTVVLCYLEKTKKVLWEMRSYIIDMLHHEYHQLVIDFYYLQNTGFASRSKYKTWCKLRSTMFLSLNCSNNDAKLQLKTRKKNIRSKKSCSSKNIRRYAFLCKKLKNKWNITSVYLYV